MIQTLKIAGGKHILVSTTLLGKYSTSASDIETNEEKEKMMAVYFILRSNESRYNTLFDGLKRSANLGREKYPATLTEAFNLLVRESGEYGSLCPRNGRYRTRGRHGGRDRHSYLLA